jgi:hypothetical protein
MPSLKKKPKTVVRLEWMEWHPSRRWHMQFWLKVGKQVRKKNIRQLDRRKIMPIIRSIDT